jgi:hypothetical protein
VKDRSENPPVFQGDCSVEPDLKLRGGTTKQSKGHAQNTNTQLNIDIL